MKEVVLGFLIFVAICFFAWAISKPPDSYSLLGEWEGRDDQGRIHVLLMINESDLVVAQGEGGAPSTHSYTIHDHGLNKEMEIEGFGTRFIVRFANEDSMYLGLTEVDARQEAVPVMSIVKYSRKK